MQNAVAQGLRCARDQAQLRVTQGRHSPQVRRQECSGRGRQPARMGTMVTAAVTLTKQVAPGAYRLLCKTPAWSDCFIRFKGPGEAARPTASLE